MSKNCRQVQYHSFDKLRAGSQPNERSSHSTIVLRGGGIIFLLGAWVWALKGLMVDGAPVLSGVEGGFMDSTGSPELDCYPFFLIGLTLVAGVSFVDDIRSLPNSLRLLVQFVAMALMFMQLGMFESFDFSEGLSISGVVVPSLIVLVALVVGVGASDVINFMDGVNGITGSYTLATLVPALLLNRREGFVEESLLVVAILSVVVFCYFNLIRFAFFPPPCKA